MVLGSIVGSDYYIYHKPPRSGTLNSISTFFATAKSDSTLFLPQVVLSPKERVHCYGAKGKMGLVAPKKTGVLTYFLVAGGGGAGGGG